MMKTTALLIILGLRVFYQPSLAQNSTAPFASLNITTASTNAKTNAKVLDLKGVIKNNKVILDWIVSENETADLFEIEKSTDGKTYTMAALVFGTDKPATDNYQFYEKAGNKKVSYRIKIINKDKQTAYSAVVEIIPSV